MSQVYKKINVEIKGITPLLMNRLNPESLKSKSRMKMQEYSTETDAANSAYITEIGGIKQLYIPQEAMYSMIINTAKQYKIRRTSLSSLLAGTMRIEPEKIPLGRKAVVSETEGYVIDERAVVIQNQRVLKGRAKIPHWSVKFQIVYDGRLPSGIENTLKEILEDAGTRMGLLDYRPQHKGWFGTFSVISFALEDPAATVPIAEEKTVDSAVGKSTRKPKAEKAVAN